MSKAKYNKFVSQFNASFETMKSGQTASRVERPFQTKRNCNYLRTRTVVEKVGDKFAVMVHMNFHVGRPVTRQCTVDGERYVVEGKAGLEMLLFEALLITDAWRSKEAEFFAVWKQEQIDLKKHLKDEAIQKAKKPTADPCGGPRAVRSHPLRGSDGRVRRAPAAK